MPLIKSKSKKAFSKNVEAEMHAGKSQPQSLAIAYSVKKKAPKKKASGGTVESGASIMNYANGGDTAPQSKIHSEFLKAARESEKRRQAGVTKNTLADTETMDLLKNARAGKLKPKYAQGGAVSATNESRPSTTERNNDSMQVSENANKKELIDDQWTSRPDIKQSTKGMKTTKIKHPKMVPQNGFSTRMRDEEDDLQSSAGVNDGPQHQPPTVDNEEEANKSGPDVPALHMKRMAEGGEINDFEPMSKAEEDNAEYPAGLESDNDEMRPPKEEYMADHMQMLAEGGIASEDEIEHAASIAAAIMARRKMAAGGSVESGSEDMNYADGGRVDIESNNEEEPNEYYSLNEGEALDFNSDDSMGEGSPDDSGSHGDELEDEDEHSGSLASKIRAKAKASKKSPITR